MRFPFRSVTGIAALSVLVACGGGGDTAADTSAESTPATEAAPADAPAAEPTATVASANGEEIYQRCVTCHMADGNGMAGAFPPLAGSEWVTGPAARPIAIVMHGLQGEITVKGATYNSMMMAYGTGVPMSDDEIAAVLTYVRSNFGNSAPAVTPAEVAAVRAATAGRSTPMTVADLEALQ
jgi:mono/diheme cytochrome c family protein